MKTYYEVSTKKFPKVLISVNNDLVVVLQNALKKGVNMEKEMLAIARIKSGEGKFEKFMGFMQSDEGMAVRKTIAHVEKTVPAIGPDKSYVMFKVSVHNEEEMKKFASGNNPIAKPIFDECVEVVQMYELSKVNL